MYKKLGFLTIFYKFRTYETMKRQSGFRIFSLNSSFPKFEVVFHHTFED